MMRKLALGMATVVLLPVALLISSGPGVSAAPGRSDLDQVSSVPTALQPAFLTAARRFALPPALLVAVAQTESNFDVRAVGPPVPGGPALGMMQFLPGSWEIFNVVPGATPFDPGPAVLAAAHHLLTSGRLPGGAWDAARALLGYNRSGAYVRTVLAAAAQHGYRYSPAGPPLDPQRYVFPVIGPATYGTAHHDYPATDVFGDIGQPIVASVRSEVLRLSATERGLGGITITLRGEDGWRYYYAHLDSLDPALRVGQVVEAGQPLGTLGKTGNARSTPPHLHLGISSTGSVAGQITPYPYLQLWQKARAPSARPRLPGGLR